MTTTKYANSAFFLEAHFVHGLAPFVQQELRHCYKRNVQLLPPASATFMRLPWLNELTSLNQMRTVSAWYLGRHYAISRPKALLGHQHFQELLQQIVLARRKASPLKFCTLRVEAAGDDSPVFRRLRQKIATATALIDAPDEGELQIRVFPTPEKASHWTVLCRLSPRPLSARAWRVFDRPGALNATIAAAMIDLGKPRSGDRFLNLMCGSATLLIERLMIQRAVLAVGCDIDATALAGARQNIDAAALTSQVHLLHDDATCLPYPPQSFDHLVADLPWGQLIGDHEKNVATYPKLLQEAARVATHGASFVLITTEARLLQETMQQQSHLWKMKETFKLNYKNVHAGLFHLQRTHCDLA